MYPRRSKADKAITAVLLAYLVILTILMLV